MVADFDVVVIGAGVIGLAVARSLSMEGFQVLILESAPQFGTGTSSRNSEVIHAGIYYPPKSLKARFCVRGRELLYDFCVKHRVRYAVCGKLIVATDPAQMSGLQALKLNAEANGVHLNVLSGAEARAMEPELRAEAALHSPCTGIIDSHSFMAALLGEAEANGAQLVCRTRVTRLGRAKNAWAVTVGIDNEPAVRAHWIINAAGLDAHMVSSTTDELAAAPQIHFAKGSYFGLAGRCPFTRLIYPLPEPGGLGVHLTLDLGGRARFGPDVEWVHQPSFDVDPTSRDRFARSIANWWPNLAPERLVPDFAGVRPKLTGRSEGPSDFRIDGPFNHGMPGLINIYGIESPGLTSSLALAEAVTAITKCKG